jgi:hypothetical protein
LDESQKRISHRAFCTRHEFELNLSAKRLNSLSIISGRKAEDEHKSNQILQKYHNENLKNDEKIDLRISFLIHHLIELFYLDRVW